MKVTVLPSINVCKTFFFVSEKWMTLVNRLVLFSFQVYASVKYNSFVSYVSRHENHLIGKSYEYVDFTTTKSHTQKFQVVCFKWSKAFMSQLWFYFIEIKESVLFVETSSMCDLTINKFIDYDRYLFVEQSMYTLVVLHNVIGNLF